MKRLVSLLAALCVPGTAAAYTLATDTGDPSGTPLRWPQDEQIEFRLHYLGGGGLPAWLVHGAARQSFDAWVSVPTADIDLVEGCSFSGVPCPHAIPESQQQALEQACGTSEPPPHDYQSALYFMELAWPFGEEVIALTTLSWAEGGRLVDADISFNGVDYDWTASDEAVLVDYRSIATHEIGHFFGLGHSDVAGAIMRPEYDDGTIARELGQDDVEGIASIYPCAEPPCRRTVGYVDDTGCGIPGGRLLPGLVAILGAGCAAGLLLLRRRRAALAAAPLLAAILLLPVHGSGSTVLGLSISDLAARSDRVVLAMVGRVQPYADRLVRSRIDLEVVEDWKGEGPARVALDQPGGVLPGMGTLVFGMPRFQEGEEYVLFLSDAGPFGTHVVGLAQGAFRVERGGRIVRDTSGLMLARVGGAPPPSVVAPARLEQLRAALR